MKKYLYVAMSLLFISSMVLTSCNDDDDINIEEEIPSPYEHPDFTFQSKYVTIASGKRIHYVDEGEGDPLILVHGGPTSAFSWRNLISELSNHARVIAYDQINYGGSDKDLENFSYDWKAENLKMFLDAMNIDKAKFVVTDIGGPTTFTFGSKYPSRVAGIVIYETVLNPLPSKSVMPGFFQDIYAPDGPDLIMQDNYLIETLMFKNQFNGKPAPTFAPMIIRDYTPEEAEVYRRPFAIEGDRKHLLDVINKGLGFLDEPGPATTTGRKKQTELQKR